MAKILLLDDEPAGTQLLKMALEFDGFEVVTTNSLQGARQALTAEVAAVILDYHLLKGESGLTLLHEIRTGETILPQDAPVIVTSGDDRCEKEATDLQASHVLIKPFSPGTLTVHLRALIGDVPSPS